MTSRHVETLGRLATACAWRQHLAASAFFYLPLHVRLPERAGAGCASVCQRMGNAAWSV